MRSNKPHHKLPALAQKGFESAQPNQHIVFTAEILPKLSELDLITPALTLLMQLKPNQRVQYVTLEQLEYREPFLTLGLIKTTKVGKADRYIVPKTAAYCVIKEQKNA